MSIDPIRDSQLLLLEINNFSFVGDAAGAALLHVAQKLKLEDSPYTFRPFVFVAFPLH